MNILVALSATIALIIRTLPSIENGADLAAFLDQQFGGRNHRPTIVAPRSIQATTTQEALLFRLCRETERANFARTYPDPERPESAYLC
jgi:hypothetical protein